MMPEFFLTRQAYTKWMNLPEESRLCFGRSLFEMERNASSGQELWGKNKLYSYRSVEGTEIVYRVEAEQVQVLAFRLPKACLCSAQKKFCAIILAAGKDDYKETPLQLTSVEGTPLISRITEAFMASEVDDLVVVLGYQAERIKEALATKNTSRDINVVVNPNYAGGLSSSLKYGLRMVPRSTAAVLLTLGNRPFINSRTVNALIAAYKREGAPAVVPVCQHVRGHPIIFDAALVPDLLRAKGNVGGKSVLWRYRGQLMEVVVDDDGILRKVGEHSN
jgi:molybdenum cofactor cytidylyltransferase